MVRIGSIVVRCYEFDKMLQFWRQALGYVPREAPTNTWVVLRDPAGRGPNLSLERFPENAPARGADCILTFIRATERPKSSDSSRWERFAIPGATDLAATSSSWKILMAISSAWFKKTISNDKENETRALFSF